MWIYERTKATLIGIGIMFAVLIAFSIPLWIAAFRSGQPAVLLIPVVFDGLAIAAFRWAGGVTPSRIGLHESGQLDRKARWRTIESTAAEVQAIVMPHGMHFNSRVRIDFTDGRKVWILSSGFDGFGDFACRLLLANPNISAVNLPAYWMPRY